MAVQSRQPLWRRAMLVAAGVVSGAAAAGALLWRPQLAQPAPVARFAIALPQGQQLTQQRQPLAISPDGQQIVYAADGRLYLRSLSDIESRAIPGADQGLAPVFSPDGQSLVFWADSMIKRIAVSGGPALTICQVGSAPSGITWEPDGILFAQAGTGILRVSPNGGTPEPLVRVPASEGLVHGPQSLPGDNLLFTILRSVADGSQRRLGSAFAWDQAQVVVQSLKSGQRRTIIEAGTDGRYVSTGHMVYAVGGTVFAAPFDVASLEITGSAVPILAGVGRATSVTGGAAALYAFSSSGSMVYVPGPASAGRQDVTLFDRTGGAEALKLPAGSYAYPRVSPDGKRLALETSDGKDTNVSIYELSGATSIRRLTFGGNNRFPIWSADGQRVAFQSDREGDPAVFWQPADGGTAERLTTPERGTVHLPESWSPGDTFLFSAAKGSDVSLWTFSIRDRKATPFGDVRSLSLATDAVFSPDGKWVAYQVGEVVQAEGTTYIQPFPPNGTKYQIARGGRPAWSRDGRELFYVPTPTQFVAVKVTTQPSFAFGNPTPVPRGFGVADPVGPRPYDVMPDGRFVGIGLAAQTVNVGPAQLHVVLNWTDDLKSRVRTK